MKIEIEVTFAEVEKGVDVPVDKESGHLCRKRFVFATRAEAVAFYADGHFSDIEWPEEED